MSSKRSSPQILTGSSSRHRSSVSSSAQSSSAFESIPSKRMRTRSPPSVQHSTPPHKTRRDDFTSHPISTTPPPQPGVDAEDDDDDAIHETVLALDMRLRETVGAAYFVARTGELRLFSDIKSGGLSTVEQIKVYIQPTVVLLPSRVDEKVSDAFEPRDLTSSNGGHEGDGDTSELTLHATHILEMRPSNEFSSDNGKTKLGDMDVSWEDNRMRFIVPGEVDPYESYEQGLEVGFTARQGKMLGLSSRLDLDSDVSVGCAGALLTYIKKRRAAASIGSAGPKWRINEVDMLGLEGTMYVSADALSSLNIFVSESHPHVHSQGAGNTSGTKEDLSVYGLFHHFAGTPQGKYILRQSFLRPSLELNTIQQRHVTVSVFLRPENDEYVGEMVRSLKSIKNMRNVMVHLRKGMSSGVNKGGGIKNGVWTSLRSFAFHAMGIEGASRNILDGQSLDIIERIQDKFDNRALAMLGTIITETVDFPLSLEMHRAVVNPGIDVELDELKRTYDGLEDLLGYTSRNIAESIPQRYGIDLNVVFFPQIGFLISMPEDPQTGRAEWEGGEEEGERWEKIFSTDMRVYYKDYRMFQLDVDVGDVWAKICDREIEIIHDLAQRVLEYEVLLCTISDICGELDSLLALAQGAKLYKLTRPHMTEDNVIEIQNGRHILQELTVPAYIGNDTHLVGGSGTAASGPLETNTDSEQPGPTPEPTAMVEGPSILMMTGPNYSGKSVFLKQVALIVYLAHVGSFVPADRAMIGLTDKILSRISTRETVSKAQSAFMIDLQQVISAINMATRRSLLVIDEFGKGTNATDGAGLVCGVFEHLLDLGEECPKVLSATHFHEIFESGFLIPRPRLQFGHMEVQIDEEALDLEDQVTYLYQFRPGRSISSLGTLCASFNGIDKAIVNRADDLILLSAQGHDLISACASMSAEEVKNFEDAEEIARRFLEQDFPMTEQEYTQTNYKGFLEGLL